MNILNSINHSKGNLLVFTQFMFDISLNTGGTLANNVEGTANNYPISFKNNKSYGVITNFNKDTIDGKSFTLYIKEKLIAYSGANYGGIQAIIFTSDNSRVGVGDDINNFLSVPVIAQNGQRWCYYHKSSVTIAEVYNDSTILNNLTDYLHIFIRFDQVNLKMSFAFYNKNAGTGVPIDYTYSYTGNPFSTFTKYYLGHYNNTASQKIDIAGWYNGYLSKNDMVNIVQKSSN